MSWDQIQGHARPIKSFQAAWRSHRLGQGYLFVGPAGVGKLTFAKELAKAVLCENPGAELRACDTCRSCILARAGTHPDILRAEREEDKNVLTKAVVDNLCGELVLKPALGKRRVAIVDDAVEMNEESANRFLKTLEEPSLGALLILIGGPSPDLQLRTIQSRCQTVQFGALTAPQVRSVLSSQTDLEYAVDELSIALSGGSPGVAIAFAEPKFQEIRAKLVAQLSLPNADPFLWAETWLDSLEEFSKEGAGQRQASRRFIHTLLELVRRAWLLCLGTPITPDAAAPLAEQLAQKYDPDRLEEMLLRLQTCEDQIDRMAHSTTAIEALAMDLATV